MEMSLNIIYSFNVLILSTNAVDTWCTHYYLDSTSGKTFFAPGSGSAVNIEPSAVYPSGIALAAESHFTRDVSSHPITALCVSIKAWTAQPYLEQLYRAILVPELPRVQPSMSLGCTAGRLFSLPSCFCLFPSTGVELRVLFNGILPAKFHLRVCFLNNPSCCRFTR